MDARTQADWALLRDVLGGDLWRELGEKGGPPPPAAVAPRLRAALDAIGAYVPAPILREQLLKPAPGRVGGAFERGSILFADLSGFTALSGQLSTLGKQGAEEISAIISALFGALVAEIQRHGGSPLKFGGDALTAFFDEGALGAEHARQAAGAALAMQARMAEFAATATRAGTFTLRLRVGVHSGALFAAQVGDASHIELVVTGHAINRVAAAQEVAEPGQVVISDETLAHLGPAATAPRQAGFHLLAGPVGAAEAPPSPPAWAVADDDPAAPAALAERIAALWPYLPRGVPHRFLGEGPAPGEFRPVTVLFAHFWPFSQLLDGLGNDPATATRALNAYYRRAQAVVHRYGGIVNKVDMYTHGDKLMALFGAPAAHEDDPERAVRCALDLRAALEEANAEIAGLLGPGAALAQRAGLNTGVVFAGRVGGPVRHEYTVMGQPVNLAARLMGAAAQGAALLSPTTRRAVARRVALRELPPVSLKGIAGPVPVAEALHALPDAGPPRRAGARRGLVGRRAALRRLLREGRAALAGEGRVVALWGAAGVGKTRLIDEALGRLARDGADICRTESHSYAQNSPASTLRALLRALLGPELAAPAPGAAVEGRLAELAPGLARFAPLLGELLALPIAETPLTAALAPEQRAERLADVVAGLLCGAARRRPLALALDDLHWCDASSLALLGRLLADAASAPLLVLLAYRREAGLAEPWLELAHCRRVELGELGGPESARLLAQLLGGRPAPELLGLLEKTQGNPFFIEELVGSLQETGELLRDGEGWRLRRPSAAVGVPDSIEGLITARLDRLEERARETLQVAAVVGQRFAYPVLTAVVAEADDLARQIERLDRATLIAPDVPQAVLTYMFRHNLVRDVAYDGLLFARRRELHRRVARVLEGLGAAERDEELALLARHYLLAEAWPEAFAYHLRAGRAAQRRYANREAIALLAQALQIDEAGLAPAEGPPARGEIHERLGWLQALGGDYDGALGHYRRALGLAPAEPLDDRLRLHHHIARVFERRADFETAFGWVEAARALAGPAGHPALTHCLLLGAGLHQRQGRYGEALDWGGRALALSEAVGADHQQAEALMLLGGTYSLLGEHARAHELTGRCLELCRRSGNLNRLADAHNNLALIDHDLGRLDEAQAHYAAGAELKQAIGDVYGEALIANNLGDLLKLRGDLDGAVAQFRRSLASFERLGSAYGAGALRMNLGASHLLRGDLEAAAADLAAAEGLFAGAGAEDFLPELLGYRSELARRRGDPAAARALAERAVALAARSEAHAEEAIARRALALALADGGDPGAAWAELERGLAALRAADSPYEIARTLLAQAALAPALGRPAEGRAALDEALIILAGLGAARDLAEAEALRGQ